MEYFVDEVGKYVYKGSGDLRVQTRLITIIMVAIGIMVLGASVFMYFLLKKQGALGFNPILPFMPVMTFPVTILVLIFVRKRMGAAARITLDYMNGLISFSQRIGGAYRQQEIMTSEIRKIVLSRSASSETPFGDNGPVWTVSLMTPSGQHQIMADSKEINARGFAGELASLVSCSIDDLTREV